MNEIYSYNTRFRARYMQLETGNQQSKLQNHCHVSEIHVADLISEDQNGNRDPHMKCLDEIMEIEIEGHPISPVYNEHGFQIEESTFRTIAPFFDGQTESQNFENLSGSHQFEAMSEYEPCDQLVKVEVKEEEVPNYPTDHCNDDDVDEKEEKTRFPSFNTAARQTEILQQEHKKLVMQLFTLRGMPVGPKKRPGKMPFSVPKDVGRHFLKVHMKKCVNYVFKNMVLVSEELNNYFFGNPEEEDPVLSHKKQRNEFIRMKTREFKGWLIKLKIKFKEYGKEDFRSAYMNNHAQFCEEIEDLEDTDIPGYIKTRSSNWNKMVFKEILRRMSLKFIKNTGEDGLRYQLVTANNILVEEEHLRYAFLTEWLIEEPARIDKAVIFGKKWVLEFFRSIGL